MKAISNAKDGTKEKIWGAVFNKILFHPVLLWIKRRKPLYDVILYIIVIYPDISVSVVRNYSMDNIDLIIGPVAVLNRVPLQEQCLYLTLHKRVSKSLTFVPVLVFIQFREINNFMLTFVFKSNEIFSFHLLERDITLYVLKYPYRGYIWIVSTNEHRRAPMRVD